jgi:uncharacterized protein YegL
MVRLPDPVRSRAVLIGAGVYADERVTNLPSAAHNVEALGRRLAPMSSAVVVDPHDVAAVLEPVRTAAQEAEDVLLVYFAGHGLLFGGRRDLHLAVGGSDPEKPWTAVPYTQLADLVRDSVAAVKVVILDCCFSGRAIGVPLTVMAVGADVVEQVDVEGVYVITSSPGTRASYALPDSAFTAFTGALLEALTATTEPADGPVPLAQLFERVRRRMRAAGLPEPQQYTTNTAAGLALARRPGSRAEPQVIMPFYVICDVSAAVAGDLGDLREALRKLAADAASDPVVDDLTMLSVIAFGSSARTIVSLSTPSEINVPSLVAGGGTNLGAAFREYHRAFGADRARLRNVGKNVYRPFIFLLSGTPPDDSDYLQTFRSLLAYDPGTRQGNAAYPYVAAFGFRNAAPHVLQQLAYPDFGDRRGKWFHSHSGGSQELLKWMSAYIGNTVLPFGASDGLGLPRITPPGTGQVDEQRRLRVDKRQLGHMEPIAQGGMGKVYRLPGPNIPGLSLPLAYKELADHLSAADRAVLVHAMEQAVELRAGLDSTTRDEIDRLTVWPVATVEDDGRTAGVLMPMLSDEFFVALTRGGQVRHDLLSLSMLCGSDKWLSNVGIDRSRFSDAVRLSLVTQLTYVIGLLHRHQIVFGDLNLRNVAIATDPPRLMLLDCDSAAGLSDMRRRQPHAPFFRPPEMADQPLQDQMTDVYKLGLCILRVLAPGRGSTQLTDPTVLAGTLDRGGVSLITRAISADRDRRPTAEELHYYFRNLPLRRTDTDNGPHFGAVGDVVG